MIGLYCDNINILLIQAFFSTFSQKLKVKKLKVSKKLKQFLAKNSMQRRHFCQKLNFKVCFKLGICSVPCEKAIFG